MIDRTIKPKPAGKINFNLPPINSYRMKNELQVFHVLKNSLPIVQVNLIVPAGSIYNKLNKSGTSSLTSMLIDEGAGNLTGLEISDLIERKGSILNINSSKEFATISLLSLKENLKKSMEVFSLIVKSPNFQNTDYEREFGRLKTQLIQLNDDPSYIASTAFNKIIYGSTPYQYPYHGELDKIDNVTNEDIKQFYNQNFQPQNSFLIVVGDITSTEMNSLVEVYLDDWKNTQPISAVDHTVNPTKRTIALIDKPEAAQSEIRVGHFSKHRKSKDFYSRTVLNSILGGQFSSRINLNLREDKGYTYGAHSSYSYNQLGSTFFVSTSVKSENSLDSVKEIINELNKIKSTITQDELDFSKSYLIRRYPSLFETYSQVATNLSLLPIYGLSNSYFENYIKNIKNVSLEMVNDTAIKNILLNNLVVVVVGNKNLISEDLKTFAEESEFEFKLYS
jgi:zinc protease